VKICGITRPVDAQEAAAQGADAIGLVFYPPSPRAVTAVQAVQVVKTLPPFVTVVGLFVNATREEIRVVLSQTRIDMLQFHGDEKPADCSGHGRPYIKALRMRPGLDLHSMSEQYAEADGLLLDSYKRGKPGGTGETFQWDQIPTDMRKSIVLAGGLNPENVEQAIHQVRPFAVDVSGGVERDKGIKDGSKIAAFMRGVEHADE